ncbi:MAG: hypothetical protein OXE05_03830 [Chloroflexi bacterium]|nr:hypothetical protein [Chloroflexota bacterium]
MTLRELYETAIEIGLEVDPRGREALDRQLAQRREEYAALPDWRKPYYDQERFNNPYGDVRIVNGPQDTELATILMGINIGTQELLLADNLRDGGTRIDAVVAHHTNGIGVPADTLIYDTVPYLVDLLADAGVDRADAEPHIQAMMADRWQYAEDFNRNGIDMAQLLGFPLACIHTPADFHHGQGVRGAIEAANAATVGNVVEALLALPEFQGAARIGAIPRIMAGDAEQPVGRIFHQDGGGWMFPAEVIPLLREVGVGTFVTIGCPSEHQKIAEELGMGWVRMPHGACDNVGLNLLLDKVEQRLGPLNVIACSYFERVKRN